MSLQILSKIFHLIKINPLDVKAIKFAYYHKVTLKWKTLYIV